MTLRSLLCVPAMGTMWENGSDRTPDAVCHYEKTKKPFLFCGKGFYCVVKEVFTCPIKRFVYAAEEVAHAEKETLSCCETGFVMSRKSLFHTVKKPLSYCGKASFMT